MTVTQENAWTGLDDRSLALITEAIESGFLETLHESLSEYTQSNDPTVQNDPEAQNIQDDIDLSLQILESIRNEEERRASL